MLNFCNHCNSFEKELQSFKKTLLSVKKILHAFALGCEGIKEVLPYALILIPDLTGLVLERLLEHEELVLVLQSVPRLKYLDLSCNESPLDFLLEALKAVPELEILRKSISESDQLAIRELYPNIRCFEKITLDGSELESEES